MPEFEANKPVEGEKASAGYAQTNALQRQEQACWIIIAIVEWHRSESYLNSTDGDYDERHCLEVWERLAKLDEAERD